MKFFFILPIQLLCREQDGLPTVLEVKDNLRLERVLLQNSRMKLHIWLWLGLVILVACGENSTIGSPPTKANTAVPTLTSTTNANPTPTLVEISTETAVPPPELPTTIAPNPTATQTAVPTEPIPTTTGSGFSEIPGATVPPGFSLIKFADIFRPTSLTFDANGRLFVTSFDGTIHILSDLNGDGRSESDVEFASGYRTPLGIAIHPGTNDIYLSSTGQITLLRDENGDNVAEIQETFVSNIPYGLHQNDNLKFGPDGWLYMGIGSTCDACTEADNWSATLMRFNVDTGENEIVATGLRNPYDLAFHPVTGDLFATDNGRDDLGLDKPFEELNLINFGSNYGWPNCWNRGEGTGCAGTETAVAFFEAHSSANGLDFYVGNQFPTEYQNNAFVTIFGTFLTDGVETGIARIQLTPDGDSYQSNISWFAQWPDARPLPIVVGPDGAIYVGDYLENVIYRISYEE